MNKSLNIKKLTGKRARIFTEMRGFKTFVPYDKPFSLLIYLENKSSLFI